VLGNRPIGIGAGLKRAIWSSVLAIKVWSVNSEKLPTLKGLTWFVLVAIAASLSLLGGFATAQRPAEPKPLWQINERKLGVPRNLGDLRLFEIYLSHGFGFQNNNTLLISWITPDGPLPRIPKKASPIPAVLGPSHLHTLFLDAKTGTRVKEGELAVPSGPTELFISHSGNLLVGAGSSLKLYTPDFVLLNQADLPAPIKVGSFDSRPRIEISPDSRRIIVFLCSWGKPSKTAIFDADDLKALGSLRDGQQRCPEQLGDDSFLSNTSNGSNALQSTIQSWENEPDNPTLRVAGDPTLVRLLNGDAYMVANGTRMEVRTIDGKLLMTDDLPKGQGFRARTATDARDSTNFAVETTRVTLEITAGETLIPIPVHLPSPYQLAVYSLEEKKRVFTIKAGVADELALSPDGSLFATLSNGWLRVYKLPEPAN
jgi:hypothetical protein